MSTSRHYCCLLGYKFIWTEIHDIEPKFFEPVFAKILTVERPHFFLQDKDTKLVTIALIL